MKIKLILGIIFVLVFLAACPDFSINRIPKDIHVEGTITYSDTGEPVAHCRLNLSIMGNSYKLVAMTSSNENGWYCLKGRVTNIDCFFSGLVISVFIEEVLRWSSLWPSNSNETRIECSEGLQIINIEIDP